MFTVNYDFEAQSFRECAFYIEHLYKEFEDVRLKKIDQFDSVSTCSNAIKEEIGHLVKGENARNRLIKKMKAAFKEQQLSDKDFLWLDSSDVRFCNWVWCYLRSNPNRRKRNRTRENITSRSNIDWNEDIEILNTELLDSTTYNHRSLGTLESISNNTKDRYKDIIKYFHTSELSLDEQKTDIKGLIRYWEPIFEDKRIVNWLNKKDDIECDWAWKYIKKFNRKLLSETWSPTNDNEKKQAIISLFDRLHDRQDSKSLLIGNMKRAWNQKKFRDKKEGKKAYSISMTETTKQQLDKLTEHKGLKINETIELLIRTEFKNLNN
ncbi:MAG: hypothetical protein ACTIM4_16395 [Marinomonas sp.]|uniref:hypothetical protein n=1 Tax=Marinomonas sp. TI.3.20 TaxID=3121296 RepID=UPI00311EC7B2